jgi:NADPH-dependent 2,4-dienoyl-CoA reductase/sulfur reductase-like enzyme
VSNLSEVVVVGASLAGLRSVEALRRAGFDGRVVVIGAEVEPPYDRPPLSKEVLAGKWDAERTALRKPESYDELAADWRLGSPATGLDLAAREVHVGDGRVPFQALVIATGATPRTLPGTPELEGIHVLRTLSDALSIRRALEDGARVAVVGAGVIGAEVAAACRGRGLQVTMIDVAPVPLERSLGREMGTIVADLHRDHGVDLRLGVAVDRFEGTGRVERLRLSDGTSVEADLVVVGVGARPETRWLEDSGLALEDGVLCGPTCEGSAPRVFAAGDVARWHNPRYGESMRIEHWTNATEQADAAVAALLHGADAPPYDPIPYVWSDQYDVKIQQAGWSQPDDVIRIVDGSLEERRFVALYGRGNRLTGVVGFRRPRLVMKYRRMMREGVSFGQALADAEGSP